MHRMPNLRTHPHVALYNHTYMLWIICLKKNKFVFLAYPPQLHELRELQVDSVSTFLKLSSLEALPILQQAYTYVKNVMLYIMWCLWAFCQIVSIFLFQVLMILDTHYARGGNVCPASLPSKSSPWQVRKGVRAQHVLLRWIETVPSWLRIHDSVLAIIASTSVHPPNHLQPVFSPLEQSLLFIPNLPTPSFPCAVANAPLLSVYLDLWLGATSSK